MHVLILSLSLRGSKFTLSWLLRNTQQDINYWWVGKLWNEGRDRSLQKKIPCLYLLVCNISVQCPGGALAELSTESALCWGQAGFESADICYSGCAISTRLALLCALAMGMWSRLPRAKPSTPCVWGGLCMAGTRALHMSFSSTWPLWRAATPACASFRFETPFFCRCGARADLHLHRNLCGQQAPTFIMEVHADNKKGVLLLCFCVTRFYSSKASSCR